MRFYKILKKKYYIFKNYKLVPIRKKDIQKIRIWRNDQIDVLRQKSIIRKEDQEKYFRDIIIKSFSEDAPTLILFSFLFNEKLIGYGGITNINWKSKKSELSFLLDTKRINDEKTYSKDFSIFLDLIFSIVFNELNFKLIFTETFNIRPNHIRILEKKGFILKRRIKAKKHIQGSLVDVLIHHCKGND